MSRLLMDFADQLIQLPRHHPSVVIAGFLFTVNSTHSIHLCYITLGLKPPSRKVKYYNGWKLFTLKLQYFKSAQIMSKAKGPTRQALRVEILGWVFFCCVFFPHGGFRAKQEPPPTKTKKTSWNTHHIWMVNIKKSSCLNVSFLFGDGSESYAKEWEKKKHIEQNRQYQGFTGPTTRSLKHQQDWLHTILPAFSW